MKHYRDGAMYLRDEDSLSPQPLNFVVSKSKAHCKKPTAATARRSSFNQSQQSYQSQEKRRSSRKSITRKITQNNSQPDNFKKLVGRKSIPNAQLQSKNSRSNFELERRTYNLMPSKQFTSMMVSNTGKGTNTQIPTLARKKNKVPSITVKKAAVKISKNPAISCNGGETKKRKQQTRQYLEAKVQPTSEVSSRRLSSQSVITK